VLGKLENGLGGSYVVCVERSKLEKRKRGYECFLLKLKGRGLEER